ncbi:MAG: fibronectin type III-like domain-contianing protein, partial [Spirochaetales bacterium]|nr:fibronectin type III-like domain-contianing protein [Spirochaetales bacterium]
VSEQTGDEVIQLYIGFENSTVDRPVKLLRGFKRVTLDPDEEREVELFCAGDDLAWYNPDTSRWELEDIEYQGYIGTSASPATLKSGTFRLRVSTLRSALRP